MNSRHARLDQILTYIVKHPYATCNTIANHLSRDLRLIQSDVRMLHRAGLIKRRKADNSRSRTRGTLPQEYYLAVSPQGLASDI